MSGATGFEAQKIKPNVNEIQQGIKFTVSGNIDRYLYNNTNVRYMGTKYKVSHIFRNENIADSKWNFWNNQNYCGRYDESY